ncbi:MAG: aldehyde ferredoxin oxidoreductase family protein [Candidatus Hodarchaeota archaeon]
MIAKNGMGFTGKILHVNLTNRTITNIPTPMDLARQFIGGGGLAARILYPLLKIAPEPLGPHNPVIMMAGPFTGTTVPCSGRMVICARSPLTNLWGECNIGGYFGATMRQAGYDGLLIEGRAKKPSYLSIIHGSAQLHDAQHLWTKTVLDTQESLRADLKEKRFFTLSIGPAGEHLVKYANIMSEGGRAAGRMGLGAVLGSKHLKSVAVVGNQRVPVAQPDAIIELARTANKVMIEDFMPDCYRMMGTATAVGPAQEIGAMPNKYFTEGEFPTHDNISGATLLETRLVGRDGCHRCPIQCGRVIEIPDGKYQLPRVSGPEYETLGALGSMILVDDLDAVIYASHLCDNLGLDTISCGNSIGFAYYLVDQGKLSKQEVGMNLEWGDPEPMIQLIPQIAQRQGFGAILAEGTQAMGVRYAAEDMAVQIKGLEVSCWDPRALFGMATIYATSPRGGCHLDGDMYMVLQGQVILELGIDADDPQTDEGMGEIAAKSQSWRQVSNALIMCQFPTFTVDEITQFYSYVTGEKTTPQQLLTIGDRIITLKRLINLHLGFKPEMDNLPKLLLKPLESGGTRGLVPNIQKQLADYNAYRDWDPQTGHPSATALKKVGLADLIE